MSDLVVGAGVGSIGSTLGSTINAVGVVDLTSPADPIVSNPISTGVGAGVGVGLGGVGAGVGVGLFGGSAGSSGSGTVGVGVGVGSTGGSSGSGGTSGSGDGGAGATGGASGSGSGDGGSGSSNGGGAGAGSTSTGAGTGGDGTGGTNSGGTSTGGVGTGGTSTGGGAGSSGVPGGGADGSSSASAAGSTTTGGLPDTHTAFINIFRLGGAADISSADSARLAALDQQVSNGTITQTQAILQIGDWAAGSTAVAETSYQFFTGLTPTADGLSYLVHSPDNSTDLSDAYYSQFDLENRYINFASNLGLHSDAAPGFAKDFGSLSFSDAVATAYDRIVGDANAQAAGIDYQAAIADIISRQPYFQEVAQERFGTDNQDLSTKLAAVAYIMEESVRADVGRYGQANQNFLFDLADGKAQFHVDLVGVYGHGSPANVTF